ncbi:DUF3592 domain-containing protein [Yoonia sp. R2-816]|uniref:DUF3592 domain-containing protein n=1 Tax=Yoonia sp. R2-816 TaxID=3342638 RepID=UPI0037291414
MNIRPLRALIIAGIVLTTGIWLSATAISQLNDASILQRTGVETTGTVSQKWIVAGESKDTSHRIRYTFQLNDQNHTFERSVPIALHRVVHSGSNFRVTVSPQDPDLHEIFPGQLAGTAQSQLIAGLIIGAIGVAIFFLGGGMGFFRREEPDV